MNKYLRLIFIFCILYLVVALVASPQICIRAAHNSLLLCIDTVIPSLFPFLVCTGLLTSLGFSALCSRMLSPLMRPLFNLPGAAAQAVFMGALGGYPIGAVTAVDLYSANLCNRNEAQRIISFCNNSGPLFVIGVIGTSYLNSTQLGIRLYISHIFSAFLMGILLKISNKNSKSEAALYFNTETQKNTAFHPLEETMDNAVSSILKICGFVIFFGVFSAVIPPLPILHSLIEVVGGLKHFSALNSTYTIPLISFFLAFSGLSVIFQVCSIIVPAGFSVKPYLICKSAQGVISAVITYLWMLVSPIPKETFAQYYTESIIAITPVLHFTFALCGILTAVAILYIAMILLTAKRRVLH